MKESNVSKEARTTHFREKNLRRKEHKNAEGARGARTLRKLGISRPERVVIPMADGEDVSFTEMVAGVPGAFGWATKEEWNERIPGTSGCERV